jgi:hypothetical protein
MEKDSGINASPKTGVAELLKNKEWAARILFAIPGLIGLGGSIGLLQNVARASMNNIDDLVFVDNWIPWLAVWIFALGWFTVQWIETALLNKQAKTVKVLFFVLLLEYTILSISFHFFVDYEMLHRFGFAVPLLNLSGAFLRYSMLSKEALVMQRKVMFGKKFETSS